MPDSLVLAPLDRVDPAAVEALLDQAFGHDRHRRTAYRLREHTRAMAGLSFAALAGDGALAGSIQCWPVALVPDRGDAVPLVLVGPVAVAGGLRSQGIGRRLVEATLAAAALSDDPGAGTLTMIGDPDYYGRFFGFAAAGTASWVLPGPVERHRLLVRGDRVPVAGRLVERVGAGDGVVR